MPPKKLVNTGEFCDLTETRGIKVYYEWWGPLRKDWQGEKEDVALMLLGSVADLRKTADQQYIRQSEGYLKILTYDHRNTGQTTIKDEPCTMEDYGDDAAALLQAVCPDKLPINVIGVSFGGMVAQHLALRHPHLVKKLVLCCCGTGGTEGASYPIHEWYVPGFDEKERVIRRVTQANQARNEDWQKANKSEWSMVLALVGRDEGVGKDEPLRKEGINRQLEARKAHDTTDKIGELQMDVLVCGSPLDGICPPSIQEAMAERIGPKCKSKLNFGWGHPFLAADVEAMPYINAFLRDLPLPAEPKEKIEGMAGQIWEVVGGGDKGGIVVRERADLKSLEAVDRLATGSLIKELSLEGERLHFVRLNGKGPKEGWVSLRLKDKDLVVKSDKTP